MRHAWSLLSTRHRLLELRRSSFYCSTTKTENQKFFKYKNSSSFTHCNHLVGPVLLISLKWESKLFLQRLSLLFMSHIIYEEPQISYVTWRVRNPTTKLRNGSLIDKTQICLKNSECYMTVHFFNGFCPKKKYFPIFKTSNTHKYSEGDILSIWHI